MDSGVTAFGGKTFLRYVEIHLTGRCCLRILLTRLMMSLCCRVILMMSLCYRVILLRVCCSMLCYSPEHIIVRVMFIVVQMSILDLS